MLNNARIAKDYRMGGNVYIYITVRCNHHIVANGNISNDCRIDTYPHSIANCWTTFSRAPIRLPYNNTFMNVTIATYFSFTIDGYIICVTYITPPARPRTAVWGVTQRAEPLSRLHLSPSKGISFFILKF